MYLQESLVDADGRRHRMAGIVPGQSTLVGKRLTLGYREVRARRDSPIATAGQQLRGHEFHWSVCDPPGDALAAYDVMGGPPRAEGYASGNVLASYVHMHFASDPGLARRFVDACASTWPIAVAAPPAAQSTDGLGAEGPPALALGVGCSAGTSADEIEALARAALESAGLPWERIRVVATIDQRIAEPGMVEVARRAHAVLVGFPAAALASVVDVPTPSDAIEQLVNTPGVCEPAAILASDGGTLVVTKQRSARATVAIALLPRPAASRR
jgi:hypothetical protein